MMDQKQKSLRNQGWVMIIALIVQYILGIYVSFFVKFPESGTEVQYWQFANTQVVLGLHMALGLGLLIGAIALLVRAVIYRNKTWQIVSIIGLVAMLVAAYGGERFISLQSDTYSFLMAVGFIVAFISFSWGLYASKEGKVG